MLSFKLGTVHNFQHFHKRTESTLFAYTLPLTQKRTIEMLIVSCTGTVAKTNISKAYNWIYLSPQHTLCTLVMMLKTMDDLLMMSISSTNGP